MFFMDWFLKTAFKWRNPVCLGMFFFGAPMIYFFRDGLGIAPGSSVFTYVFLFGPLFLLVPYRSLGRLYRPNTVSYMLGVGFLVMSAIYLYVYAPNRGWFTNTIYETIVIGTTLYMFFSFTTVSSESLGKRFLQAAIYISLVGSIFLLIYLVRNPAYAIGGRASIELGKGENTTANPHVFARGAFLGLVAALMYLKHDKKSSFQRLIVSGSIVIFSAVILLTQAMSTILSTLLFLAFYFKYSVSFFAVKRLVTRQFTKWYFWAVVIGFFAYATNFYSKNREPIRIAMEVVTVRGQKLINTFFTDAQTTTTTNKVASKTSITATDMSSQGRIENFNKVVSQFNYNIEEHNYARLLFGNGYHELYVDIPILEPLNSFGIVGFVLFLTFFIYISLQAFREIRNPKSITSEFVAYAFIYFFVYTFTNGLIIEYTRWGFFVLTCRFLPVSFSRKTNISTV